MSRWERMYNEGRDSRGDSYDGLDMSNSETSEVRIISFDLDNTIWKTDGCINAANDALAVFLNEHDIQQPTRVEVVMKELFRSNKERYSPILGETATHATLLTLLRTDAIQQVLEVSNGYSAEDAKSFAETAFNVWAGARHNAIPQNLASNVIECLESLSMLKTFEGYPILIGAITDGNSDPRRVSRLAKYFDFCVNAESVGVSKPDKRVYLEAIRQVRKETATTSIGAMMNDILMNSANDDFEVGSYWVHVGDDFVKDIVAAKDLRMRTVWSTELVQDKLIKSRLGAGGFQKTVNGDINGNNMKEFMERVSEKPVVEMSIGADDYLADSLTAEFADAVTSQFHQLTEIITKWHEEGLSLREEEAIISPVDTKSAPPIHSTADDLYSDGILSVIMPEPEKQSPMESQGGEKIFPRAFRISREDCTSDVVAPMTDRETRTMKEVMEIAQLDKASGVFAFSRDDADGVRIGKKVLMMKVGTTGLEFSREIFARMTIAEVLSFTDENPVTISMYIKEASSAASYDFF